MPGHYLENDANGPKRITFSDNANFNSADNPWRKPKWWESASQTYYKYYQEIIGDERDNIITGYGEPDSYPRSEQTSIETIRGEGGNDKIYGRGGSDNLYGGIGNDQIYGQDGSDNLYGGIGNDVLASGDLRGSQNDNLYGGTGADLFILGEVDNTSTSGFNWSSFVTNSLLSSADNFVNFIPGASTGANALSLFTDIVMSGVGATQQGVNPTKSTKAVIHDFNPIEDVVVIPLQSTGRTNVGIDAPANGNGTIQFRYEENNSTDYFAELNLQYDVYANAAGTTSRAQRNQDYKQSLLENALIIDEDGIQQGWEPNASSKQSGNRIKASDLGIDLSGLEGQRFLVLGAYAGQQIEGTTNSDTLHGTKYGDRIYGYDVEQGQVSNDGDDFLHGYGGDDEIWGGSNNDSLYGGQGHDKLYGGQGNDSLYGGENYDYLTGGGGKDKFYLTASGGARITDFESGVDTLMVHHGSDFAYKNNWFTWNGHAVYDHDQFYIVKNTTADQLFAGNNVQTFG